MVIFGQHIFGDETFLVEILLAAFNRRLRFNEVIFEM